MAVSFKGAKKYKKHAGNLSQMRLKIPLPSPMHFYSIKGLTPVVEINSRVLCGQKLADIDEFDKNPVISGVSGNVISVNSDTIMIENDMTYLPLPVPLPAKPYSELTTREIFWLLREGGVYEQRCQAPLHVLLAKKNVPECIIVCCFDSDPYISSPQAAAYGNTLKIKEATELCLKLSGVARAYIAVENNTKKTFADFKAVLRYNEMITPYLLKARYPQSEDGILIKTVTGSENTDALILSPETLVNMMNVLESGIPVTKKIVTVSGDDILEPENYTVPLGAAVSSVLESNGYNTPEIVISGGVIDGVRITDFDTPVTHDTKALAAFYNKNKIPKYRKKLL